MAHTHRSVHGWSWRALHPNVLDESANCGAEGEHMSRSSVCRVVTILAGIGTISLGGCAGTVEFGSSARARVDVMPSGVGRFVRPRAPVPLVLGAGDAAGNLAYAYYLAQRNAHDSESALTNVSVPLNH